MAERVPWQVAQAHAIKYMKASVYTVFMNGTQPWPYFVPRETAAAIIGSGTLTNSTIVYGVNKPWTGNINMSIINPVTYAGPDSDTGGGSSGFNC